jgi:hypothetical protein
VEGADAYDKRRSGGGEVVGHGVTPLRRGSRFSPRP